MDGACEGMEGGSKFQVMATSRCEGNESMSFKQITATKPEDGAKK